MVRELRRVLFRSVEVCQPSLHVLCGKGNREIGGSNVVTVPTVVGKCVSVYQSVYIPSLTYGYEL